MNNITLKQLRYVDALARYGHFRRAAESCTISQPALSMQIKELEVALGTLVFERGLRQVRLTTYGEQFLRRAREILNTVEELVMLARAANDTLSGPLRIGVIPTIAPYLLPMVIRDLGLSNPGLDIQIRETMTARIIDELEDGRLDTAIIALPVEAASLVQVPLFREEFVLVRPLSDRDKPVPNQEELRHLRLLLLEEGHCFREQALAFCQIRAQSSRNALDGSSLSTLVQMVGVGLGVTLIPEIAVAVETRSAPVDVRRFAAPLPSRQIGIVWRRSNPLDKQFETLAELVRAAGQRILAPLNIK